MRVSTNKQELIKLEACSEGLETFVAAHGDSDALFSASLKSNGIKDVFWLLCEINDKLSKSQLCDLRLLACDYAALSLHIFENKYPNDKRPRLAIQARRDFAAGKITQAELLAAVDAARDTAWAAARGTAWNTASDAAWAAARAAAWAAASDAAWAAASDAAWAAAWSTNTKMLMDLFLKWGKKAKALKEQGE